MILKLARKEEKKHRWIYLFIKLQISVTLLIGISCGTIFSRQMDIYTSFRNLIDGDGMFVYSVSGVRTPEEDVGSGISGTGILEKYMRSVNITGCYHILAEFMQDGNELSWNATVYDDGLVERQIPLLSEGEWFSEQSREGREVRAVVSPNDYGLGVGDCMVLAPYEGAQEEIRVRIIGILDENAQIVSFQPSDHMVSCQNFMSTYEQDNGLPALLMVKSDFEESDGFSSLKMLWPAGMFFIHYKEGISDEERTQNEKFIQKYFNLQIEESLSGVREKSQAHLRQQMSEIVPVLIAAILFLIITTMSISVLGAKYAIENYRIYHMLGLQKRECGVIQLCLNVFILAKGFIFIMVILAVLNYLPIALKETGRMESGVMQLAACLVGGGIWLIVSLLLQNGVLNNSSAWRIDQND